MDIELQKEKFWDWWFNHRDDELEKREFLKAAFFAGIKAAQLFCPSCNGEGIGGEIGLRYTCPACKGTGKVQEGI